jgi:hypothetical protein
MIQLPRKVHPATPVMKGLDILAYKRALRQWEVAKGIKPTLSWPPTTSYGRGAIAAVQKFQAHHGLQASGVIGLNTYGLLYPHLDAYDLSLLKLYVKRHPILTERDKVIEQLRWLLANHDQVFYGQVRPVALARFRDHLLPITSDCSGSIIGANFAAGAPDPGGNNYDGSGNTASFLLHLTHITRAQLRPADIVVFGALPGDHAVCVLDSALNVYTHGHAGVPDDPSISTLANMEAFFKGEGVTAETFLRVNLP